MNGLSIEDSRIPATLKNRFQSPYSIMSGLYSCWYRFSSVVSLKLKCGDQQRTKDASTKNAVLIARPSSRNSSEDELPFELLRLGFFGGTTITPVADGGSGWTGTEPAIGVLENGFM